MSSCLIRERSVFRISSLAKETLLLLSCNGRTSFREASATEWIRSSDYLCPPIPLVTDRGGFKKYNRIIDLSKKAFESIADLKKGIILVSVEVIK